MLLEEDEDPALRPYSPSSLTESVNKPTVIFEASFVDGIPKLWVATNSLLMAQCSQIWFFLVFRWRCHLHQIVRRRFSSDPYLLCGEGLPWRRLAAVSRSSPHFVWWFHKSRDWIGQKMSVAHKHWAQWLSPADRGGEWRCETFVSWWTLLSHFQHLCTWNSHRLPVQVLLKLC